MPNMIPVLSQGRWLKATCDLLMGIAPGRVLAVLAHHTSTVATELNDSTDGGGADFLTLQVPANDTLFLDFSALGGIPYQTGCFVDLGGGTVWVCIDDRAVAA